MMALNIAALVALLVFYALILVMGVWASRKSMREEKKCVGSRSEVTMIGGRNINIYIGIFTMTATWVGGGYIMGTAEAVYTPSRGVIWALGPPSYVLLFLVGGLFFAKQMRSQRYVTMMDPFQHCYGDAITTALLLPSLLSDILWVAGTLSALGGTVSVILDLHSSYAIIMSAGVAITYTMLGGLYSVAYTDVIQLLIIFISLCLCVPFVILHPSSSNVTLTPLHSSSWMGELKTEDVGKWIDEFLLLSLGGLCFQCFYQRVLSAASPAQARIMCFASMIICFIMGIPSFIIGAVAVSADWNQTEYGLPTPFERGEAGNVLPLVLHNLAPSWVSVLGIGALAAAVMSSVDSAMLSFASMFTQNIYKGYLRKQASEREYAWVIRLSVLLVGLAGAGVALTGKGVMAFWLMSSDLMYCTIFPQIICVIHCPFANGYGAATGYFLGTFLRLLSGEPLLHIPPVLTFPGWREDELTGDIHQYFPFRSLITLLTLLIIPSASLLARLVFTRHMLPPSWDVLDVLREAGKAVKGVNGAGRAEVILPAATETTENLLATSSTSSCSPTGDT